jgi:predicted 2-oxoglutarate/Fe(II)-dependent dioxygenase YbiX
MFIQEILFTKEECKSIIDLTTTWYASKIVSDETNSYTSTKRNSIESNIHDVDTLNYIILDKLSKFNITSLPKYNKLIKYTTGSYFTNHNDRGKSTPKRLLTLIIQLSEERDYTGAELLVDGKEVSKKIGNLLLFDSGIYHEVKPLTSGERFAFVTWIENENMTQLNKTLL